MWGKVATAAALGVLAAGIAHADARGLGHSKGLHHGHTEYVYARVVDVQPIIRHVTVERPRRECWTEAVHEPVPSGKVAGATIAGGIVGAAVGRQFGGGSGRDALTMLGAVAGAAVANQRAIRNQGYTTREVAVERCEIVGERFTEEHIDGYRVTYLYDGRRLQTVTATHPGDRIRLAVEVHPVGHAVSWR